LTLRALSVRLTTGYGAIYHHVADRNDLLAAATDHVIAHIVTGLAANARALASSKMDRSAFLAAIAARWAQLDPARYPSVHRARTELREHDDREQFLAGIDLILAGIEAVNRPGKDGSAR
jgi:AcrR family transcriptional regulator